MFPSYFQTWIYISIINFNSHNSNLLYIPRKHVTVHAIVKKMLRISQITKFPHSLFCLKWFSWVLKELACLNKWWPLTPSSSSWVKVFSAWLLYYTRDLWWLTFVLYGMTWNISIIKAGGFCKAYLTDEPLISKSCLSHWESIVLLMRGVSELCLGRCRI